MIKRRKALGLLGSSSLTLALLPQISLPGCSPKPYPYPLFTYGDTQVLNAIANIILPPTPDAAGAEKANVGDFVQLYISDCLNSKNQEIFLSGYGAFKQSLIEKFNESFDELNQTDQVQIVRNSIETIKTSGNNPSFFSILKSTILRGYFTSEIGMKQALAYLPIPGYQEGVTNLELNQKAWAI